MIPGVSFDLNLGSVFSPLLLVVLLWALKGVAKGVTDHMDANARKAQELADTRHTENTDRLDRIEAQTTKTNGTVLEHSEEIAALKTDLKVERELTKLLTEMLLQRQPDKGT